MSLRIGVALTLLVIWGGPGAAQDAPPAAQPRPSGESPVDSTRATLRRICEALNEPCLQCGGRAARDRSRPLPTPDARQAALEQTLHKPVDAWGSAIRVSVNGAGVKLESAGADGAFGTADDVALPCTTRAAGHTETPTPGS
jgi:hypothetical protein